MTNLKRPLNRPFIRNIRPHDLGTLLLKFLRGVRIRITCQGADVPALLEHFARD